MVSYPLAYPRLEARRVQQGNVWLVAVINHATAGKSVTAKLPWLLGEQYTIRDLTAGGTQVAPDVPQTFAPLAVHLYQYERKRSGD